MNAISTQYAACQAVGLGRDALRPIGKDGGIQRLLAEAWTALEAAWSMGMKAAWLYDQGLPCGAEANAATLLSARASRVA